MGKSGYLPDISGVFQRWRQYYLDGLSSGNWNEVSLGLSNMNGSLDDEYRLPVSTETWIQNEDGYIVWDCSSCTMTKTIIVNKGKDDEDEKEVTVPTRSKRTEIKIFTEQCSNIVVLLSGLTHRRMWVCPSCDVIASVSSVKATMLKYPEPHYRDCIYSEPEQPITGLKRRRGSYPQLMRTWAKFYSRELEHKLALYRLEYIKQNDGVDMEFQYKDKGGD